MSRFIDNFQKDSNQTKCSLFISNLSDKATDQDLINFFKEFEKYILLCQIDLSLNNYNLFSTKGRKGIIIFNSHDKANEARNSLNMMRLLGRTIYLTWHETNSLIRRNNRTNLFIKGIPLTVTPREFYVHFLQFGDITSARLCEDEDGKSRGYGYVSYSDQDSLDKVVNNTEQNCVWGVKLTIAKFQKKNERMHFQTKTNMRNTLYIKNIPPQHKEEDLKKVFEIYGKIVWFKMSNDGANRQFAFLAYEEDSSAEKAREKLNGFKWDNKSKVENSECLYVDYLQKKNIRQKILQAKIAESNIRINSQYRNCNLHVRNLPPSFNEEKLHNLFSQYGEIKTVKIPKYILVTKVGKVFKEFPISKLFGYVCFVNQESAEKAISDLNGKFIEGEEMKRPLLVDNFMPKNERKEMMLRIQNALVMRGSQNIMYNPYLQNNYGEYPLRMSRPSRPYKHHNHVKKENIEEFDLMHFEELPSLEEKKDYLGEFIFKRIQNHAIAKIKNFDINVIAKITGMILGINNINEIIEIARSYQQLTERIQEALDLIENKKP